MSAPSGVVACGGFVSGGVGYSSECFSLPYNSKTWLGSPDVPSFKEKRHLASSFIMNYDEVWVAGGTNGNEDLSSIEVRHKNGTWIKSSVELPVKTASHCMVKIDENLVLMTGGFSSPRLVYLFDKKANQWEKKRDMMNSREFHSCAVLEGKKVIVSGGGNADSMNEDYFSSSEIFDPTTNS